MNIKTKFNGETISEGNTGYGAGGAFPNIAPIIEAHAASDLAGFLFPGEEDSEAIIARHGIQAACPAARAIEANRGEEYRQVSDGEYACEVTVDGAKHNVLVEIAW